MPDISTRAGEVHRLLHEGVENFSRHLDHKSVYFSLGHNTRTLSPSYMRMRPNRGSSALFHKDLLNAARLHVKTLKELKSPEEQVAYMELLNRLVQNSTFELPNLGAERMLLSARGKEDIELPLLWAESKLRHRKMSGNSEPVKAAIADGNRLLTEEVIRVTDKMLSGQLKDIQVEGLYEKKIRPKPINLSVVPARKYIREDAQKISDQLKLSAMALDDQQRKLLLHALIGWTNQGFKKSITHVAEELARDDQELSGLSNAKVQGVFNAAAGLITNLQKRADEWQGPAPFDPSFQKAVLSGVVQSGVVTNTAAAAHADRTRAILLAKYVGEGVGGSGKKR